MAIPLTAAVWEETMDPCDFVDYGVEYRDLLQDDEEVTRFTVSLLTESTLLGLQLGTGPHAPKIDDEMVTIWLSVDPAKQEDAVYQGTGVNLPIEFTFFTNSQPERRRQRTAVVRVVQK